MQEFLLTKEKQKELVNELEYLTNKKRKEIADSLEYAKSLGDLSENAEYHEARANQVEVENRIGQIEHILKYGKIVKHTKSNIVEVGSKVLVKRGREKTVREFSIVGAEEANMLSGKISNTSPLGSALMGKEKGDIFKFKTPAGEVQYTVVKVD